GTGRLVYLGVVEGDRVRAGQVIARIEDADVKAQLAQAQANLQVSRAELHDAQRSLARERFLADSGASSQASVDAAEARHERVKASIAAAEATVLSAQVSLENTVIRAPFDGTVLTKNADVGEVVAPLAASAFSKSAVVTIADLRSLQVEADVAESNLEATSPGQACEIVLDAYPDVRYPGSVAMIVPTADRAKATVQVKVAFHSYDARVLPEMSAKVHFLPRPSRAAVDTQPVLVVPSTAVAERNGRSVGGGRGHGRHQTERIRGGPLARHPHRVRVPILQPTARAHGLRVRRSAAAAGAALQGRAEAARRDGAHTGRPRRPDAPLSAP